MQQRGEFESLLPPPALGPGPSGRFPRPFVVLRECRRVLAIRLLPLNRGALAIELDEASRENRR